MFFSNINEIKIKKFVLLIKLILTSKLILLTIQIIKSIALIIFETTKIIFRCLVKCSPVFTIFKAIIVYARIFFLNIILAVTGIYSLIKLYSQSIEIGPKKMKSSKSPQSLIILNEWLTDNLGFPYASKQTKQELAEKTNLTINQVSRWLKWRREYLKKSLF